MNIFGIGPLEILLVLVLALILFGPQDLQKTGKMLGRTLNKLIHSDAWQMVRKTGTEINNLPRRLMKEAALDDIKDTIQNEVTGTSAELGKLIGDMNTAPLSQPSVPPGRTGEPSYNKTEDNTGVKDHA